MSLAEPEVPTEVSVSSNDAQPCDAPATVAVKRSLPAPEVNTSDTLTLKKARGSNKAKPQSEIASFPRYVAPVFVTPSMSSFIHMIEKYVLTWRFFLNKSRIPEEVCKKVLYTILRQTFEAHHVRIIKKDYPFLTLHTDEVEHELPTMLSRMVSALDPKPREHFPDLCINLASCLEELSLAAEESKIEPATSMEVLQWLEPIKQCVIRNTTQWVIPFTSTSLIDTGFVGEPCGLFHVVSRDGGSRRDELIAGYMRLREFTKNAEYYVPCLLENERNARIILSSYVASTESWSETIFDAELFGPICTGLKVLTAV